MVIGPGFLVAVLLLCGQLSAQPSRSPDRQISRTSIGGVEFTLELPDAPLVVPALPDLSRSGVYELPGGLLLQAPLPVIWAGTLLPPGKHMLSIEVDHRSNQHLLAQPLSGGPVLRIPMVRGILDRPGERIRATLATVEGGNDSQLFLQLQWGALVLSCDGEKISLERQEVGEWILDTYRFPSQFTVPVHCVIGAIENRKGDEPLRRLVYTSSEDGSPKLRLEDPARERTAAAREELLRSLKRSQKRLRRIEGGAASQQGEKVSLRKRIDRALQQRSALDDKLAQLDAADGVKILLPSGAAGPGSAGLRVLIEKKPQGMILRVESARGSYQFSLASGN
ncbi:MAG: hypothetical protein CMJ95_06275 [Planctomycetes bacterium]|nr:hypothetical protein [Planctomycetota bacterium]